MTPEEFVEAIRMVVLDAAVHGTTSLLEHPPGRRPGQDLLEMSGWYRSLSEHDRGMLVRVVRETAHQAVFNFLAVLDNVAAIEDDSDKGQCVLLFRKGGEEFLITDPNDELLHDILNRE